LRIDHHVQLLSRCLFFLFGWCGRRQVGRWSKQYMSSVMQPMPSVLRLMAWLQNI
jgi:hypothetical protein